MWVEPARSTHPKGPRIIYFDDGNGWLTYTFVPRAADPQIMVELVFWMGVEPSTEPAAEP